MASKYTQEEIIARFKSVHGDRFDYSKVKFKTVSDKVCIVCPEHGDFWMKPSMHIRGQICKKCARKEVGRKQVKSKDHYIALAKEHHGDKYDYSMTEFDKSDEYVTIVCPIHGEFTQKLSMHVLGRGCPDCANEKNKRPVHGVGINDLRNGEYSSKCYEIWAGMLERCYNLRTKSYHLAYKDCSVCEEWHYLSNFAKWFTDPANGYHDGYHLDKDILVKGNKVYSPNTCCFVPTEVNGILVSCKRNHRNKIIGVGREGKNGFRASITKYGKAIRIGVFRTEEEAFVAYKQEKESYIKEVAESCYKEGRITKRVYDALMCYEVEFTD